MQLKYAFVLIEYSLIYRVFIAIILTIIYITFKRERFIFKIFIGDIYSFQILYCK